MTDGAEPRFIAYPFPERRRVRDQGCGGSRVGEPRCIFSGMPPSIRSVTPSRAPAASLTRLVIRSMLAAVVVTSCRTTTQPAPGPTSVAAPAAAATASAEPSRFQQDVLLEGVFDEPTEIAVARDGRVFIAERHGVFSVYDPR